MNNMIDQLARDFYALVRMPWVLGIAASLCLSYVASGDAINPYNYILGLIDGIGLMALGGLELLMADIKGGRE